MAPLKHRVQVNEANHIERLRQRKEKTPQRIPSPRGNEKAYVMSGHRKTDPAI